MVTIVNINNSVVITIDGNKYSYPKGSIIATQDDKSETVNIRLTASRKTIHSLISSEVSSPSNSGSADLINKLNSILY